MTSYYLFLHSHEARHVKPPKPPQIVGWKSPLRTSLDFLPTTILENNMHRCHCSTRALETFFKDFAGLSLRQQRAQRFFQHSRSFGTRSPLRQVQTSVNGEDAFIPFDFEAVRQKREGVRRVEEEGDGLEREVGSGWEEGGEEWCAEVEIMGSDARGQEGGGKSVESVSLRALHTGEGQREASTSPAMAVLHPPALSQHMPTANSKSGELDASARPAEPQVSKRISRKLRRMEQGTWRPNAQKRMEMEEDEAEVDKETRDTDAMADVLEKIEALEGPAVEKKVKRGQKKGSENGDSTRTRNPKGKAGESPTKLGKLNLSSKTPTPTTPSHPPKERWQTTKAALVKKLSGQPWSPNKRLSPDTLSGIRALHASDPTIYSTATLASHFQITPEAIRRILKSKWLPSAEEAVRRSERWEKRGLRKWGEMREVGMRPPRKWRVLMGEQGRRGGIGKGCAWEEAVEQAGRLPMEGSFADRIL
ncbi:hypothetical protein M409DRAFT_49391 [Zasmidium cellare ATCC 36951]|uniref:Required for respiratory growth protein 9, mitochondrial n=1 Tax=Zasmidium cellare ATCC 36951 TaxID=1080233 RepID=A0A6A6D5D8_ZASCE|nr:uncharacterized protein M409DRAFT_49391 [Zasmidium cellare ATCC 36951]KAF2172876.1 hypothetical protein M409DRAFT_49391 [Zasmidium cellare ATCC 36951]